MIHLIGILNFLRLFRKCSFALLWIEVAVLNCVIVPCFEALDYAFLCFGGDLALEHGVFMELDDVALSERCLLV